MTGYSASSADYVRARNTHKTTSRIRDSFSIEFVLPSVQREFRVKLLKLSGCPWHESVLLPVHKTASWNHVLGITRIKSIPSSPDSSFPMRQDCICWQNPNRCPGNRPGASTGPGQLADEGGSSSGFVWVAVRWSTCITFRARVSPWLAGQADRDWLGDVTCYDCRMSRWPPGRGRPRTTMTATLRWCHCHIQVEWHSGCSGAARGRVTDGGRHHEVARLGHPQRLESA